MTMLENAARAASGVQVGEDEKGYPVFPGPNTAMEIARAVLMAVRGEVCDSVVIEFIDEVIGERPTEKNY